MHGELLKLGFEVAQSSVAKYMVKRRGPPSQGWRTFLRNHAPDIAAMDLFVVPTIGFRLLYGFVIVRLHRRDLVWINVTANPTAEWVARQITEAFPWNWAPRFMIRDRDRIYGAVVTRRLRSMGIRDKPTAPASPWQDGFAERLIASIRRECLDDIIVLGEVHLRQILQLHARYYNDIRTHCSLDNDAPVNVAFHTVSFPITVLGSGEPWKFVDKFKVFNWLNWYGDKFSASRERGIFMDAALEILHADAWRWILLSNAPETSDTAFTLQMLKATVNSDLANVLGNFVVRLSKFCSASFGGLVPEGAPQGRVNTPCSLRSERGWQRSLSRTRRWTTARRRLRRARSGLRRTATLPEQPWTMFRSSPSDAAVAIRTALALMVLLARISYPVIPNTSRKILRLLPDHESDKSWPCGAPSDLPRAGFFKRDLVSSEKLPERGAATGDSSLVHHDKHLVQRQIRLLRDQGEQPIRLLLQGRSASSVRHGRGASVIAPTQQPI
jgi:hypothetical protein